MKGDVKTLLRRYCLESTVMGIKYLYISTDRLSRCLWAMTLIVIFTMACILTGLLYRRFDEMPTRITIENQYELIQNVPYPAITLCSPNQITVSATRHFKQTLVDGNTSINLEEIMPLLLGFFKFLGDVDRDQLNNLQNLIQQNRYTALEVMGSLSQRCEDFLKICYYEGKSYPNCETLFEPILTNNGMCCIFNSMYHFKTRRNEQIPNFVPRRVTSMSYSSFLTVISDYNPDDALEGALINSGTARVMYTGWQEFPVEDESSFILPHVESFHVIHPTYTYCSDEVATLPASSRKCYFEDEMVLPYFNLYHNSDCDTMCFVRKIEESCRCTVIYAPHLRQKTACNVSSIECIMNTNLQLEGWHDSAECDCPRDCVSYRYEVEMMIGNLDGLPNLVGDPYAGIVFNESTSLMHFLPASVYTKQKQETVMSLIILTSNLGGIFGLCLGCSAISVLEILFYIYMAIRNKILEVRRGAD